MQNSDSQNVRISVVVATRNEAPYIEKCLRGLFNQDFQGAYEVILVDGMSTDGSYEILERTQRDYEFQLLRNPKVNAAAGRNLGIEQARAELIAFVDGDAVPATDWLSQIEQAFQQCQETSGVGGPDDLPEDSKSKSKTLAYVMSSALASGGALNPSTQHTFSNETRFVDHIPTCNLCLKKEVLDAVGRFDESFIKGQDLELNHRIRAAGHKLLYSSNVRVAHYRRNTVRGFVRQIYRWAKAKVRLIQKHGFQGLTSHIYYWPVYAMLLGLGGFIACYSIGAVAWFGWACLAGAVSYGLIIVTESARLAVRYGSPSLGASALILLPVIHLSYACGVLVAMFRREPSNGVVS